MPLVKAFDYIRAHADKAFKSIHSKKEQSMKLQDMTTKQRHELADVLAKSEYLPFEDRVKILETVAASLAEDGELTDKHASFVETAKKMRALKKIQAARDASPSGGFASGATNPIPMIDGMLKRAEAPKLDDLAKMTVKEIDKVFASSKLTVEQRFRVKHILGMVGAI